MLYKTRHSLQGMSLDAGGHSTGSADNRTRLKTASKEHTTAVITCTTITRCAIQYINIVTKGVLGNPNVLSVKCLTLTGSMKGLRKLRKEVPS